MSVFARRGESSLARLGIVVSKKNVRLAVARNKLKRAVRESFRQEKNTLQGVDIVVVIKKNFIGIQPSVLNVAGVFKSVAKASGSSNPSISLHTK